MQYLINTMKNKFFKINNKSFETYGVTTEKELWEKVKGEYQGLELDILTETKALGDNRYRFVLSTDTKDRHGDNVMQNWVLNSYIAVLDSHRYGSIEDIIGRMEQLVIVNNKLEGEVVFWLDNPRGKLAQNGVENGFIRKGSVGFIPLAFDEKGRITKSELLEYSMVSVPANDQAEYIGKSLETTEDIEQVEETIEEIIETPVEAEMDAPIKAFIKEIIEQSTKHKLYMKILEQNSKDKQKLKAIAQSLKKEEPKVKRNIYKVLRELL